LRLARPDASGIRSCRLCRGRTRRRDRVLDRVQLPGAACRPSRSDEHAAGGLMGGRDLRLRLRAVCRPRTVERELHEELEFHLEMQTRRHVAAGLDGAEARRLARAQFGSTAAVEDQVRDARGIRFLETLAQDARYGWRLMRRSPAFTTAAV